MAFKIILLILLSSSCIGLPDRMDIGAQRGLGLIEGSGSDILLDTDHWVGSVSFSMPITYPWSKKVEIRPVPLHTVPSGVTRGEMSITTHNDDRSDSGEPGEPFAHLHETVAGSALLVLAYAFRGFLMSSFEKVMGRGDPE